MKISKNKLIVLGSSFTILLILLLNLYPHGASSATAVTNLTAGIGTGDPQDTASISPTAGSVLYLTIGMSQAASFPSDSISVSGLSGTWSKLGTETFAVRRRVWFYRGTGVTGTGVITMNYTGTGTLQEIGWVVDQATGLDTTTPDEGYDGSSGGSSGFTSWTMTTPGTPGAGDATYSSLILESNINMSPEAGWTGLGATTTGSLGVRRVESSWDSDADTTDAWTWDGSSQGVAGFIIILNVGAAPPPASTGNFFLAL